MHWVFQRANFQEKLFVQLILLTLKLIINPEVLYNLNKCSIIKILHYNRTLTLMI